MLHGTHEQKDQDVKSRFEDTIVPTQLPGLSRGSGSLGLYTSIVWAHIR
jgi:hypothetical protein